MSEHTTAAVQLGAYLLDRAGGDPAKAIADTQAALAWVYHVQDTTVTKREHVIDPDKPRRPLGKC